MSWYVISFQYYKLLTEYSYTKIVVSHKAKLNDVFLKSHTFLKHSKVTTTVNLLFTRFTPDEYKESLAATTVRPEISPLQGVVVEILVTGCLVFTIFGATNEKRKSVFLPSLPIGMAVMLGVLTGVM